jgi:hypothetical protein
MSLREHPLGRREPTDWVHVERYGLTTSLVPTKPTPVVLGINWYSAFDDPTPVPRKGGGFDYWIGREDDWGWLRGGHAICVKPRALSDTYGWYEFYNQGNEGACVGFAISRETSLLNRKRYDAPWLYHEAQKIDEWAGENYDGTSVRAGYDILRTVGHRRKWGPFTMPARLSEGIVENRWATDVMQIMACLQDDPNGYSVVLVNSWGKDYPHYVHLPLEALERLLSENGEAGIVVDRT